jgi:hypothetical protein
MFTVYIFLWFDSPIVPGPPHCRGSAITLRHTTLGRTSLDEWSTRHRDLYLTTHNTHKRQTSTPPERFEPAVPASERPPTHAWVRAATGIGIVTSYCALIKQRTDCTLCYLTFCWPCDDRIWHFWLRVRPCSIDLKSCDNCLRDGVCTSNSTLRFPLERSVTVISNEEKHCVGKNRVVGVKPGETYSNHKVLKG